MGADGPEPARAAGHEEREPLGVALAVGRWHRHTCVSPRQRVPLASSYVVAPGYVGSSQLEHAAAEAEFVCRHFGGTRIEPANFATSTRRSRAAAPSLLHFVCHGEADDQDQILSLEEPDTLRAQQVRAMPGLAQGLPGAPPARLPQRVRGGPAGARARRRLGVRPLVHRGGRELHRRHAVERGRRDGARGRHRVLRDAAGGPDDAVRRGLRTIRARGYATPGQDSYAAYCFYGDPTAGLP